jgi:hypothetical protein
VKIKSDNTVNLNVPILANTSGLSVFVWIKTQDIL